jgi:hypothetical protein
MFSKFQLFAALAFTNIPADNRCIVLTTHVSPFDVLCTLDIERVDCQQFLDKANHITILAALGNVVASGSPVALKRDLGNGYSIQVIFAIPTDFEKIDTSSRPELPLSIRTIAPETYITMPSPHQVCYH